MFETGVRQLRLAMAMVWGRRINVEVLRKLIRDAIATLDEFGEPGEDAMQLVDGPFADPAVRRDFTERALRRTARRLDRLSPFYAARFRAAGVDPARLSLDNLRTIPAMVKDDLIEHGRELVCGGTPVMSTRTTGSTGRPVEVWMSRYEAELWPSFAALAGLLRDEIRPTDSMQVCISSRATAAIQQDVTVCRLAGAHVAVVGLVPPDEALDALVAGAGSGSDENAPTLLATYPSYLAQLVTAARRRGLAAGDFRLRRIDVGGEVLSPALAAAARTTLGSPLVNDTFAMTEVLPVSGRTCGAGHMHLDLNTGLVEIISLHTGDPAEPGELGSVVVTPYFPYRECMPVFRYDTRDIVRPIADDGLTCELSAIPATTPILGKAGGLLTATADAEPVTARALVEAIESMPTEPWPARYRAEVVDGRVSVTIATTAIDGFGVAAARTHMADRGLDVDLHVESVDDARDLQRVRADLVETTFAQPRIFSKVGS